MARKILLADDSVTAQNMGRRILADAGYEVITVNNGSAAIKKIAEVKPDIVMLDVYMPGYGGLEICQRIRETPELARIPVLLTVGKLEPFRAEDSVRVRADAFVIKPFEASELLTALTKLEDKIVPSAQPFSGGRFARAIAALENSAGGGREFGDADTGWKSRLKIPAPYSKPHLVHAESQAATVVSDAPPPAKDTSPQTGNVTSILPEPAVASLPHDVTPEEIAAITAAAALLAGHSRATDEPEPVPPIEAAAEPTQSDLVIAPAASAEQEFAVSSFAPMPHEPAEQEPVEAVTQSTPELTPRPEPEPEVSPGVIAASSEPDAVVHPAKSVGDEEVTAALDALVPATKDGYRSFPSDEYRSAEASESAPVTMATAGEFTGPRWVAEEVPVAEDESALVLELEMQRTYAAFAAADAARSIVGDYNKTTFDDDQAHALAAQEAASQVPDTTVAFDAAPQVEAPAVPAESPIAAVSDVPPEPMQPVVAASPATVEAEPEEKAAYAVAAASAGGSDSFVAEANAAPVPEISEASAAVSEPASQPHDSELAAAWANWKQVREAVVSPESTSQIAESSAEAFRAPRHEEPVQSEASEESSDDATEIANIVDSVLADLKPKLMKEISQKMGKGKRKK